MGIFKSKQQKEMEQRLILKRTTTSMNKQIQELEEDKNVFLEKAKTAKKNGLTAQFNLALTGYKLTVAQQRKAQELLLNFEITSQMKNMSTMTSEFLKGLSILSREMVKLTNNKDFLKVQEQFEKAMDGVENRAEQMDCLMEMSEERFKETANAQNVISDEDFEKLIDEGNALDEITNESIDAEIEEIRKKIDAQE